MDPLANMLSALKNAQAAKIEQVKMPFSQLKYNVLSCLREEGFIKGVEKRGRKNKRYLEIELLPLGSHKGIQGARRVSKPGRRVYKTKGEIKPVRQGFGISVISTSQGVFTDREARKLGIGGEVLLEVW